MPGDPPPPLPTRYEVERAAERSPLPTVCRDVLYALARRMQQGSTLILLQHQPSLNTLAKAAGWSKRHVQRALDYLEALGTLTRARPSKHDARVNHKRTAYTVHYPRLAALGTGSPREAMAAQALGLGPVRRKPRDKEAEDLGTGGPEARDTAPPVQDSSEPTDHTDPELAFIAGIIGGRTGQPVSEELAGQIRKVILARPGAQGQKPITYLRRVLALENHPERWLTPFDQEET
jgi:hypothetical protein